MNRTKHVALLRQFFEMREQRTTALADKSWRIAAADFVNAEVFAQERDRLFRRRPLLAGLSGEAARPGDYFCVDVAGLPIVVLRGEDGGLRAMVNACRHRGAQIFSGHGTLKTRGASCPFHGWVYDWEGQLLGQPMARGGFSDCETDLLGLRRLPVAEAYGLVFVTPLDAGDADDALPIDIDALLGGAEDDLQEFNIERYRHVETRTRYFQTNWKLIVDTFLESYHVFALHRESIADYFISAPTLLDTFGDVVRQIGFRSSVVDCLEEPESEWDLLRYSPIQFIIPPHVVLVHQFDHFELWKILPGSGPGDCVVHTSAYCLGEPTEEARLYLSKNLDFLLSITDPEDFAASEQTYGALAGGSLQEMVFGRNEPGLIHYHQALHRILSESAR